MFLCQIVYFNSIISVKISSVWTLSPYFTICILMHLIIFPYFSTVIFDFFVLFFRQSKLQRRKLLSVGNIKKYLREIIAVLQGKIFNFHIINRKPVTICIKVKLSSHPTTDYILIYSCIIFYWKYKDRSLFVFLIVIIYNTILYYVINVNTILIRLNIWRSDDDQFNWTLEKWHAHTHTHTHTHTHSDVKRPFEKFGNL